MEVRQELLFNVTAAYNYDESKEKCGWSYLLGMECGFLSFPWETTRLWAARATKRTAIGLALIISATSPWNLSPTRLKSSHGRKNAQPVALLKISACSQVMNLEIRLPTVLMLIETIREGMIF